MQESYGDLDISIAMDNEGKTFASECIYIGYDQFEDHDEINIRSFPY